VATPILFSTNKRQEFLVSPYFPDTHTLRVWRTIAATPHTCDINDDSINNDNGDIINNILIHKLKVECEDNKEGAKQKKNYLGYVNHFEYKSIIITKIDLFKSYIDTTHVIEASLRLAIHYSRNQLKRNNVD